MLGAAADSKARLAVRRAELVTLPLLRLLPHGVLTWAVLRHPAAFGSSVHYSLAAGGCAYMSAINAKKATKVYGRMGVKAHAC